MSNPETIEYWPGPMEGVMTPQLIRAAGELQLTERWMTPFLRVSSDCPRLRVLAEFLSPFLATGKPVTVQLMGTNGSLLAETAKKFIDLGAAGINLNCGCPSRQVTGGNAGGGALRHPEEAFRTVETIRAALPSSPLSVKLRTGWSSPAEQNRLIPGFRDTGIDKLFVHFRTVAELYHPTEGRDERFHRTCELAASLPVILNGDLDTPEQLRASGEHFGAAGGMSARGWLHDPGLLRRAAGFPTAPPETMRIQLFDTVLAQGLPVAKAIELCLFLWGKAGNPRFERLKILPPKQQLFRCPGE